MDAVPTSLSALADIVAMAMAEIDTNRDRPYADIRAECYEHLAEAQYKFRRYSRLPLTFEEWVARIVRGDRQTEIAREIGETRNAMHQKYRCYFGHFFDKLRRIRLDERISESIEQKKIAQKASRITSEPTFRLIAAKAKRRGIEVRPYTDQVRRFRNFVYLNGWLCEAHLVTPSYKAGKRYAVVHLDGQNVETAQISFVCVSENGPVDVYPIPCPAIQHEFMRGKKLASLHIPLQKVRRSTLFSVEPYKNNWSILERRPPIANRPVAS